MSKAATTDYPVNPLIANRWSPYGFADRLVSEADLLSLFEATRWAPSSYNEQPWHYLLATKDQPQEFEKLLEDPLQAADFEILGARFEAEGLIDELAEEGSADALENAKQATGKIGDWFNVYKDRQELARVVGRALILTAQSAGASTKTAIEEWERSALDEIVKVPALLEKESSLAAGAGDAEAQKQIEALADKLG